ncbi:exodeoxyribonuclease VII large subunit [Sulfuriferula plumbiphila]|nr:exodeoxyribonuclease VII large subunit [Sulfuriferula plumbiphila]
MITPLFSPPAQPVLSVSALNRLARETLEQTLPLAWIAGEISNLTRAASGHWYFSLKDASAQVRCVMFRGRNQFIDWLPDNGMQVEVRATPTLYEARGEFQLQVDSLRRAGLGALFEAFEQLKAKLEQEGLFDSARKRRLPAFPQRIGVVTSLQAAALRDVLTTLKRRMPALPVVLYPTPVQGADAAVQISAALQSAYRRAECDVLILCRGGGSIEDLWPFNEEIVARTVAASPIPIVCGIGHETDFTIADFAADLRAPTPTAAAELASPNRTDLIHKLELNQARLRRLARHRLDTHSQQLDYLARRLVHPGRRLEARQAALGHLTQRLRNAMVTARERRHWHHSTLARRLLQASPDFAVRQLALAARAAALTRAMHLQLAHANQETARLASHLTHLNPEAVLARGYSIVQNEQGDIIHGSDQIRVDESLNIRLARGRARVKVTGHST